MAKTYVKEEVAWRTIVKVPRSNPFLERRDVRQKFSESLGAGASLVPRTRQRIPLGSENYWKFRLRSCQSRKASSLSLGVVIPTKINKYRMRYVELGRDNLRSHFVFRPRHAPEWLRARFLSVIFLANEEELTRKTFTTSLNTTNPNTCEIHFPPNFPFKWLCFDRGNSLLIGCFLVDFTESSLPGSVVDGQDNMTTNETREKDSDEAEGSSSSNVGLIAGAVAGVVLGVGGAVIGIVVYRRKGKFQSLLSPPPPPPPTRLPGPCALLSLFFEDFLFLPLSLSLSLSFLSLSLSLSLSSLVPVWLSHSVISGGSRIWVTGGGGGGRGILRPQNLWSRSDHSEGLPSPPLGGPGACSPGKFWKLRCADMHFSLFWV